MYCVPPYIDLVWARGWLHTQEMETSVQHVYKAACATHAQLYMMMYVGAHLMVISSHAHLKCSAMSSHLICSAVQYICPFHVYPRRLP